MKRLIPFPLVLITLLLSASAQAQIAQDKARNYQINETHTGSAYAQGVVPPLTQKWSVNFGQSISYPLIADGKVFVTVRNASTYGTRLYALDGSSGATVWSYALGGVYYWSALCYENGRVFAINRDGLLRAFDAANGSVIWSRQLPGQYSFTSAPTVFQGVIYTGGAGSGGTVYAVSADTGNILWTASVANGDQSSPAVTTDGLYVSYSCPNVYKLNPTNGAQIWRYSTGCSGGGGKTPVLYNGRLYVRDFTDSIFDSQTGTIIGNFVAKNPPAFSGNLGFFLNGPKYFGSYGTLQARDVNSNSVVWSFTGDGFLQSAVLVVNDYVYVGSDRGMLFAVEAATGQQVWSTTAGTSIPYVDEQNVSQPLTGLAAGEGLLVVPTKTTLVAYEGDHTPPTLTWGSQTPAANASGWNNTAVDLPFTPADDLSGVFMSSPESPLHFTVEGVNQTQQVTVIDKVGNIATFTSPAVNVDFGAPVTSSAVSGAAGNSEWYSGAVEVSLTASDSLSGVASTFYRVDSAAAQTYTAPFTLTSDGHHTVNYWSVDAADNSEAQRSLIVKIDTSAPSTQATVSGNSSNGWYQDSPQVSLTASDSSSGIANSYYTIDGGSAQTYGTPFNVSGGGSHTVRYWSVDAVGNVEAENSLTIEIDVSTPTTQISTSGTTGNNGWYRSAVQITLTASDAEAGVANTYYSVDGGPAQAFTTSFSIGSEGQHQVSFWSVDSVGNTESQKSISVSIDWTGATAQNSVTGSVGNGVYFNGDVQISLTASDNLSGVANIFYRVDGGPAQTYATAFTVSGDGAHPVDFWSLDVAGNNTNSYTAMIRIDATAPSTQATASGTMGTNDWYRSGVQIALVGSDNLSGMKNSFYNVNGGPVQTYVGSFTIAALGTHTINYWSVDQANNTESAKSLVVKIDSSLPTITASSSPTSAPKRSTPVSVTVSGQVTDTPSGVKPNSATYSVVDEYGVTQPSGSVPLQSDGSYSFGLTLPATRKNKDTDGHKYTIIVRANDNAGNSGATSAIFKIL